MSKNIMIVEARFYNALADALVDGAVHALENPGKIPLELIEVQSGAYLGEDDIVRFSDRYGRVAQ